MPTKTVGALGIPKSMQQLEAIRELDPSRIIVVDTETTGLDPEKDEVLSVSIVDATGTVLFDSLVRPSRRRRWPDAQRIHGISWRDVSGCNELLDLGDDIDAVFRSALLVVGYNVEFDIEMLRAGGLRLSDAPLFDVMREFAPVNGQWNSYREDWRWSKLAACARHYGVPDFEAHGSLADAKATAACFSALIRDGEYERILLDMDIASIEASLEDARGRKSAKEAESRMEREAVRSLVFWLKLVSCATSALISLVVAVIPLSTCMALPGAILGVAFTVAITISVYMAVDAMSRHLVSRQDQRHIST